MGIVRIDVDLCLGVDLPVFDNSLCKYLLRRTKMPIIGADS